MFNNPEKRQENLKATSQKDTEQNEKRRQQEG